MLFVNFNNIFVNILSKTNKTYYKKKLMYNIY